MLDKLADSTASQESRLNQNKFGVAHCQLPHQGQTAALCWAPGAAGKAWAWGRGVGGDRGGGEDGGQESALGGAAGVDSSLLGLLLQA